MVESLCVMKDGSWERLFDVTYTEMDKLIEFYCLSEVDNDFPDERNFTRVSDESLDNAIRDIYVEERMSKQLRLDLMLIVYRLRAWTEEGDVLLY